MARSIPRRQLYRRRSGRRSSPVYRLPRPLTWQVSRPLPRSSRIRRRKRPSTASGGTWISAGTMPSAPWPWKRRTMKGKNGWSSSWPILPGISGSSGTIVSSTSRRSSRTSRTPPIWCGWTAGSWGWTMQSLGGS